METKMVEDVVQWAKSMTDKGKMHAGTSRQRITGLNQLTTVLGEDEPPLARFVLDNIEDIATRWVTKNNGSPDTMNTYKTKARSLLEEYFKYQADPASFKTQRRGAPRPKEKENEKENPKPSVDAQATQNTVPPAPGERQTAVALMGGGHVRFIRPDRQLTSSIEIQQVLHSMLGAFPELLHAVTPKNPADIEKSVAMMRPSAVEPEIR